MTATFRRRPEPSEYDDFYAGYVAQVPDGDVLELLKEQGASHRELFAAIPEEKHDHRYAPGKWTVKEVIGHLIDTERVFAYRALAFARGDAAPIPGMDQDEYMAGADFGRRSMASLIDEYHHLRAADVALFGSFDEAVLDRTGVASGVPFTVRALLWIVAGHERHHLGVLKERYL